MSVAELKKDLDTPNRFFLFSKSQNLIAEPRGRARAGGRDGKGTGRRAGGGEARDAGSGPGRRRGQTGREGQDYRQLKKAISKGGDN